MTDIATWLPEHRTALIRVTVLLVVGLPVIRLTARLAGKACKRHLSAQSVMLVGKTITYGFTTLLCVMAMRELGFKLTALLGAAGVAGVAIGFASQTSLSNLISGIFLIWEETFHVGDVIQMGDTLGMVHSVDLLSVKLRTFDNKFIRIPNETIVKTQITNVTRFPIRRFDIEIGVAYKEDVDRVVEVLADIADRNPHCMDEPAPLILFKGFGDSALQFLFGVWFEKTDMLQLRNSVMKEIKKRFDEEGIEIPFPHRTLYTGTVTDPFPIRVVHEQRDISTDGQPDTPAEPFCNHQDSP